MRSPNSLTLKPRLGITLIVASHDSLNPQLSLLLYRADAANPVFKTSRRKNIAPEIHFNYLFIDTSGRELDLFQVSDRPGKALKTLFGNFAMSQNLPFLKCILENVNARKLD